MSFVRDKDRNTRGIGAVAALDKVSSAGRRAQRAKAIAMARRDRVLSNVALGAISTGYRPSAPTRTTGTISFDTGRPPPPPNPSPSGLGPGSVTPTRVPTTSTYAQKIATTKVAMQQDFGVRPTPGSSTTPPPPLPPPVEVVEPTPKPTAPASSSGGSSSGGGGGGGGGSWPAPRPRDDIDTIPETEAELPATTSSPQISGKTLAIGAAALLGAYFLFKKKA